MAIRGAVQGNTYGADLTEKVEIPCLSDEALTVDPGAYTLVVWVDTGLGPVSRWVPVNTDGMGLFGCQVVFEVGEDAQTDVVVSPNLYPDGWNVDCATP